MKLNNWFKNIELLFVVVGGIAWLSNVAQAQIEVKITGGNVESLPIAITDFVNEKGATTRVGILDELGVNIARVIASDLTRSGLFSPINKDSFISSPTSAEVRPRFGDWRAIGSQALITGARGARGRRSCQG